MSQLPTNWSDLFDRLPRVRNGIDFSRVEDLMSTFSSSSGSSSSAHVLHDLKMKNQTCDKANFTRLMEVASGTKSTDQRSTKGAVESVCNALCRDIVTSWTMFPKDEASLKYPNVTYIDEGGSDVLEKAFCHGLPSVTFFSYGVHYTVSFDQMEAIDTLNRTAYVLKRTSEFALDDNFNAYDEIVNVCVEGKMFHIPFQCIQSHPEKLLSKWVLSKGPKSTYRVPNMNPRVFQYIVDYYTSGIVEMEDASQGGGGDADGGTGEVSHISEDVKTLLRWDVPLEAITVERGTRVRSVGNRSSCQSRRKSRAGSRGEGRRPKLSPSNKEGGTGSSLSRSPTNKFPVIRMEYENNSSSSNLVGREDVSARMALTGHAMKKSHYVE